MRILVTGGAGFIGSALVRRLVLQEQVAVSDTQRVGIGAVWPDHSRGETPVETVLESSNVLTTWYVGSAVKVALVNGECGVFKYQRPTDNKQVMAAYCNSRHSAQFPEATAPIMEDFATFSTHPLSGVFDHQFDLYF